MSLLWICTGQRHQHRVVGDLYVVRAHIEQKRRPCQDLRAHHVALEILELDHWRSLQLGKRSNRSNCFDWFCSDPGPLPSCSSPPPLNRSALLACPCCSYNVCTRRPERSSTRPSPSGRSSCGSRRTCRYRQTRYRCCRRCLRDTGNARSRTETSTCCRHPLRLAGHNCRRSGANRSSRACRKRCRCGRDPSASPTCPRQSAHSHTRCAHNALRGTHSQALSGFGFRRSQKFSMNWSRSSSLLRCLNAAISWSVMIQRTSWSTQVLYEPFNSCLHRLVGRDLLRIRTTTLGRVRLVVRHRHSLHVPSCVCARAANPLRPRVARQTPIAPARHAPGANIPRRKRNRWIVINETPAP